MRRFLSIGFLVLVCILSITQPVLGQDEMSDFDPPVDMGEREVEWFNLVEDNSVELSTGFNLRLVPEDNIVPDDGDFTQILETKQLGGVIVFDILGYTYGEDAFGTGEERWLIVQFEEDEQTVSGLIYVGLNRNISQALDDLRFAQLVAEREASGEPLQPADVFNDDGFAQLDQYLEVRGLTMADLENALQEVEDNDGWMTQDRGGQRFSINRLDSRLTLTDGYTRVFGIPLEPYTEEMEIASPDREFVSQETVYILPIVMQSNSGELTVVEIIAGITSGKVGVFEHRNGIIFSFTSAGRGSRPTLEDALIDLMENSSGRVSGFGVYGGRLYPNPDLEENINALDVDNLPQDLTRERLINVFLGYQININLEYMYRNGIPSGQVLRIGYLSYIRQNLP